MIKNEPNQVVYTQPAVVQQYQSARFYASESIIFTKYHDFIWRRKDGSLVDVEIHGVPLLIDGNPRGAFALYSDILQDRPRKNILLAGLFTGLAVMTKGPVALLVLGLTYGAFMLLNTT